MTKQERDKLIELHEDIREIKTVLLGSPNTADKGLCGDMKCMRKEINGFKKNFWILVGVLVGSGVISVGIFNLVG